MRPREYYKGFVNMENMQTFNDYEKFAKSTMVYPNKGENIIYPVLGIAGEAGEVAEKVKKLIRDSNGVANEEWKKELMKELGDVLWYVTAIAYELGYSLENVAEFNVAKLSSRRDRDKLHGSGDNR
jgi:NTP pyrophosphatase (non-canonical NTP hydrolase)